MAALNLEGGQNGLVQLLGQRGLVCLRPHGTWFKSQNAEEHLREGRSQGTAHCARCQAGLGSGPNLVGHSRAWRDVTCAKDLEQNLRHQEGVDFPRAHWHSPGAAGSF